MTASNRSSWEHSLADSSLGAAAKKHTVRHHHTEAAAGVQHRHHVLDER